MGATVLENGVYRRASQGESDKATYETMASKSFKSLIEKGGIYSMGSHDSDKKGKGEHSRNNFRLDKPILAMIKANPEEFVNQLKVSSDIELINHLNSDKNLQTLEENGLQDVADEIRNLARDISAIDVEDQINEIRY